MLVLRRFSCIGNYPSELKTFPVFVSVCVSVFILYVQMPLKVDEGGADAVDAAQNFFGVAKGLIFQRQKVGQLILVQLLNAGLNVFRQHELKELFMLMIQTAEYL